MEQDLIKLVARLTLIGLGVWIVAKASGQTRKHEKRDKTNTGTANFNAASRVWVPSLLVKAKAEAGSVAPQALGY